MVDARAVGEHQPRIRRILTDSGSRGIRSRPPIRLRTVSGARAAAAIRLNPRARRIARGRFDACLTQKMHTPRTAYRQKPTALRCLTSATRRSAQQTSSTAVTLTLKWRSHRGCSAPQHAARGGSQSEYMYLRVTPVRSTHASRLERVNAPHTGSDTECHRALRIRSSASARVGAARC